jgi:M6 family metalloprotease-like protein
MARLPATKLPVTLRVPREPFFVGSYQRIFVTIADAKIKFDDLDFTVPAGLAGGLVSPSRDITFNPKRPHILLCVGYKPGHYTIDVVHRPSKKKVGEVRFAVDALWRHDGNGPSLWFTGIVSGYVTGGQWGGGPSGPQNVKVHEAKGTRRVALLMVDTASQRYSSDPPTLQAMKKRLQDEVIDGVVFNGQTRSVREFYQEASFKAFDISAKVFGPVMLPGNFDDYFDSGGGPKSGFYQACITAGDGTVDYTQFDSVICVSQQVDPSGADPRKAAWPFASGGTFTTMGGNVNLGVISLSNDIGIGTSFPFHVSVAHELGHNLGLPDLYAPAVAGRNVGGWDVMNSNIPLPFFSFAHRLMLGWVDPTWVVPLDFSTMAAPVDQTVTLHPAELGAPPAGLKGGIEIRVADGWNYYFEYRIGEATQIGDRQLPTDSRVLGTDVTSPPWVPPLARPPILLLPPSNGDGAVLGNGQAYAETDFSDPTFPTDFKVSVSGIDGSKADVHIQYGVNSKPDPSIRPWPAGPGREWQSPDIEVQNERNLADPAQWFNIPWIGHDNTVIASVKNRGNLDAPQVRVNFYVKNYNIGGAPESFLGTDVHDIPKGATIPFKTQWQPPSDGHFCIIVRIPLYQLPANPAVVEMTEFNNLAQSNYDHFISQSASPPSREITHVEVGNPYAIATRVHIHPGHTNPMYRTFIAHTELLLDPGETRQVEVMFEYAPDNLTRKEYTPAYRERLRPFVNVPNSASVVALIEDPRHAPRHVLQVLGGAQATITTGRETRFSKFALTGRRVSGTVVTTSDGQPVPSGKVLVRVGRAKGTPIAVGYMTVPLSKGSFAVSLELKGDWVDAYYLPPQRLADCYSNRLKLS